MEEVAISPSRGSSPPRDQSCISSIAGGFFTAESPENPLPVLSIEQIKLTNCNREPSLNEINKSRILHHPSSAVN